MEIEKDEEKGIVPTDPATLLLAVLVLVGLYQMSLHNYLLFHSLVEMFSIVIACGIFMLAWNAQGYLKTRYFLFLGIAYLFVSGLDLVHTLSYKGMGVFPGYDGSNLPTQLWIATRYVEALSLLITALLIGRRPDPRHVFIGYIAVTSLILLSIFSWNVFPDSVVPKLPLNCVMDGLS